MLNIGFKIISIAFFIIFFLFISSSGALASISNTINITTLSDGSTSKLLAYGSAGGKVVYINTYKNTNASYVNLGLTAIPIQTVNETTVGNLTNGDFESNLSSWEIWGDPNNCAVDTNCPTSWCNILRNESCIVRSLFVNTINDTVSGNYSAYLGHFSRDSYTYSHSKLDLRQNIGLINQSSVLSFNTKVYSENSNRVYTYYVIILDENDDTEHILWSRDDNDRSLPVYWTFLNFSLNDFIGKNITLIFRYEQTFVAMGRVWDVVWSGTSLWYLDNIKIASSNSTYLMIYPNSPSLDVGDDGVKDWFYSGIFNTSTSISNFSIALTNYLDNCAVDITNNKCLVPLAFYSNSSGLMNISDIQIQVSDSINPRIFNTSFKSVVFIHNETQSISINATDNSQIDSVSAMLSKPSGNQSVFLSLIGGYNWNGTYSSVVDTSALSGNYSFYLNVTDILGNSISSQNYTFQVLPNRPNIASANVRNPLVFINTSTATSNASFPNTSFTLPFTATISDTRIVNIISATISNQTTGIPIDLTNNYTWSGGIPQSANYYFYPLVNYTNLLFGKEYNITIFATDIYGNTANKTVGKFKIIISAKNISSSVFSTNDSNETIINATSGTNMLLTVRTDQNLINASVSIALYNANPGIANFSLPDLNKYYEIEASNDLHTNILWVLIKVYYTDEEIADKSISEESLRIYYYNSSTNNWEPFDPPNGGVNTTANYVWANTTHFSYYSLFGEETTTTTTTQPSGSGGGSFDGGGGSLLPTTTTISTTTTTLAITSTTVPTTTTTTSTTTVPTTTATTKFPRIPTGFAILNPYLTYVIIVAVGIFLAICLRTKKFGFK